MLIGDLEVRNGHKMRKCDRKKTPVIMKADELDTAVTTDLEENFSEDNFKRSWQQAINGETVPLSELWEDTVVG